MKITNWAVVFLLIMLPAFVYLQWSDEDSRMSMWQTERYDQGLTTAVEDSVYTLRLNVNPNNESSYNSRKFTNVNKEQAVDTFFKTLSLNFNVKGDPIGEDVLKQYVPVIGVVEYNGLSLNVFEEYTNAAGKTTWERAWLPLIPFAYEDESGNVYSFTVDESYLRIYAADSGRWYEGSLEQIFSDMTLYDTATRTWTTDRALVQSIPLLADFSDEDGNPVPSKWSNAEVIRNSTLDKIRRETIVSTLQEQLAYYINEHNTYTRAIGIDYRFVLPTIPEEDWNNTVDDISLFSFIQGVPITKEETYNNYSVAGARVHKNLEFIAGEWNGMKVYVREDQKQAEAISIENKYTTAKRAAAAGYYPIQELGQ